MPNSREGRVLLWGARMNPDAQAPHDLREIDWTLLVRLALAHRVTPQLHAALRTLSEELAPAEIVEAFGAHARMIAQSNTELLRTLSDLLPVLEGSGVHTVPYKGPVLAAQAYGDPSLRDTGDLDLLLRREDMDACHAVLTSLGYDEINRPLDPRERRARFRYHACTEWAHPESSIHVEPHWRVVPWTLAADIDTPALLDRAVRVPVPGGSMPSLSVEDHLLVLCVHGTKHEWADLRWIRDLAGLLRRHPGLDVEATLARAREVGCLRMVLVGLALAGNCLGAPVPESAAARIEGDPRARRLAAGFAARLFEAGRGPPRPFNLQRSWLAARERPLDRLHYVARTIFTPRARHVRMVRLPRWLEWCYPLVKAGHDYVALPAWKFWKRGSRRTSASSSEA